MSYLLRLVLPDRPGALGAVASALGAVGADILSVDVIERSPGSATDDFVVELPPDRLADSLVSAAATVEGVHVESIRPYAGQIDPHRELELLEALAREPAVEPGRCWPTAWPGSSGPAGRWCSTPRSRAQCRVLASGGAAPEIDYAAGAVVAAGAGPGAGRRRGVGAADWDRLGTELAVSPFGDAALLVGRPALRWLPSELVRLQHLAAIAASVTPVRADAAATAAHSVGPCRMDRRGHP